VLLSALLSWGCVSCAINETNPGRQLKFVEFHDPSGNKIVVGRDWVYMIRRPHKNEQGNAVLIISALNQQIMETVDEARALLESAME